MMTRKIVVTISVVTAMRAEGWLWQAQDVALIKRAWRSGRNFQQACSMTQIAALARPLPLAGSIEDWAA